MTLDLSPLWIIDADGKPDPYGVRTALQRRRANRAFQQAAARKAVTTKHQKRMEGIRI